MITEDYVSLETAKLLKEKGFKEWCSYCYGLDVRHNGKSIDEDEEFELKDQGRENELEYVDGGRLYNFGCDNRKEGSPYAAPTIYVAVKWLEEVHHILVVPNYIYECTDESWCYHIFRLGENGKPERCVVKGVRYDKEKEEFVEEIVGYRDYDRSYNDYATRAEALEDGVKYALKKLI